MNVHVFDKESMTMMFLSKKKEEELNLSFDILLLFTSCGEIILIEGVRIFDISRYNMQQPTPIPKPIKQQIVSLRRTKYK